MRHNTITVKRYGPRLTSTTADSTPVRRNPGAFRDAVVRAEDAGRQESERVKAS